MKKITLIALTLAAGFTINSNAQTAQSATTTAGAALIQAMTIAETTALHFGSSVLTTAVGGTIVMPSSSTTRVYTGGVATSAATPAATNAAYSVTGTSGETYALTLPTTVTVTHATPTGTGIRTMNITDMKARFIGATADAVTSVISSSGSDSFTLGGTLTVGALQVGGVYSGTFAVSVDYN